MPRRFALLVLGAALATLAPLLIAQGPDRTPLRAEQAGSSTILNPAADGRRRDRDSDPHTWQTSDRVIGPSQPQITPRSLARGTSTELRFRERLAPGVIARSYREVSPRGVYRYAVVTAKYRWNSLGVAYAHPPTVAKTKRTRHLAGLVPDAVAGINGDFFDIGDTGAPLGVGVDRSGLLNGRTHGWNAAFYIDDVGVPRIGELPMMATVAGRPRIRITNVNSPQVMRPGIGIYTDAWGKTSGDRWTDGQRTSVRMMRVVKGVVVEKAHVFPAGRKIVGQIVVARGKTQSATLDAFAVGDPFMVEWAVQGEPRMALTGSQIVLRGGKVLATDDVELHPRTAVGIDRDKHRLVLLVVDGRQSFSNGFTLVQVAKKLRELGAQGGLNLDGGGSTTMVGWREGRLHVLNSPSGGTQRRVANALVITSTRRR